MQEQLISFETAKLAEEKGFKLDKYLSIDDENPKNLNSNYNPKNYQPWYFDLTQSLLQKRLREEHKLIVSINIMSDLSYYSLLINIDEDKLNLSNQSKNIGFITYEEALEDGLKEALKLI